MAWTQDDLSKIGRTDEIEIASRRADSTLRPFVTIWAVRLGDDVYVRAAYGPNTGWYRRAKEAGSGRIRAAGLERDVAIEEPEPEILKAVTAAYHAKYDRYPAYVGPVVSPEAEPLTLRLVPAS
jgi:hypothetical protein